MSSSASNSASTLSLHRFLMFLPRWRMGELTQRHASRGADQARAGGAGAVQGGNRRAGGCRGCRRKVLAECKWGAPCERRPTGNRHSCCGAVGGVHARAAGRRCDPSRRICLGELQPRVHQWETPTLMHAFGMLCTKACLCGLLLLRDTRFVM